MVISGTETLTAAAVLSRLVPDYPGWTQRRRAPLERNYFLLTRVLKSDAYAPFSKDFLRFVTSSASFCDSPLPSLHPFSSSFAASFASWPEVCVELRKMAVFALRSYGDDRSVPVPPRVGLPLSAPRSLA